MLAYPVHTFRVVPRIPRELTCLLELAHNLRWSWDHDTIELFRRLDPDLWEATGHNPIQLLGSMDQQKLESAAADSSFVSHVERVRRRLSEYMSSTDTWYRRNHGAVEGVCIAYFCAEYAITECLPLYAGGLGILAGDHLKSASDLGLPLVGVGLLYQEGYFRQRLNRDGWQEEMYPDNDFHNQPITLQRGPGDEPVTVEVAYPGRFVRAQVWRAQVGRVPLFLLDANLAPNAKEDREITRRLYPGDLDVRIRQEIMLGMGGLKALMAVGISPTVCHLNEGHTAFSALERISTLLQEHGLTFAEARDAAASNLFTTHTPVRAGIDMFPPGLVDRYLADYYRSLGLSREEFLALGREHPGDANEPFCMAILALKLSSRANGVSQLHGGVARRMWQSLWPGTPEVEVPISSVTNGIHQPSWMSGRDVAPVLIRYLGDQWMEDPTDQALWDRVEHIPDEEMWRIHERRRERLVAFARRRAKAHLAARGAPAAETAAAAELLDPQALTIGFGRRFATYKRATLLLSDPERLVRILASEERPVQIVFGGKAHPADNPGKEMIREIVHFARKAEVRHRVAFLEDYDLVVARYMIQGCDVWLNTPERLEEACGTSGMKAAANGAVNISILDGWWAEAPHPQAGWTICCKEEYHGPDSGGEAEARDLYELLEKEVVPLFYNRGSDHLPTGWISRMKSSMRSVCPYFNSHRMVREYCERFYLPAALQHRRLNGDGATRARALSQWKARLQRHWPQIRVVELQSPNGKQVEVGQTLKVRTRLHLGELGVEDVRVELYEGPLNKEGQIQTGQSLPMAHTGTDEQNCHLFEGTIVFGSSGLHGYSMRVLPCHDDLCHPHELGLVRWMS